MKSFVKDKRILYIPFYSMRSYRNGKWLVSRDGHATKARNLIYETLKVRNDLLFDVVIPHNSDCNSVQDFFQSYDLSYVGSRVNIIKNNYYANNAKSERMNFPYNFYRDLIRHKKYDMVIYDNIENARYMKNLLNDETILISEITHGPLMENNNFKDKNCFMLNIASGAHVCDKVFYNSPIIHAAMLDMPSLFYELGFDVEEDYCYANYNEFQIGEKIEKEKGSVLFMSRFSDSERTKPQRFTYHVKNNPIEGVKYYITNPSQYQLPVDVSGLVSNEKLHLVQQNNRQDYIDLLKKIETVVILYNVEEVYSTMYYEAHMAGCKVITKRHTWHLSEMNEHDILISDESPLTEAIKKAQWWNQHKTLFIKENYSIQLNIDKYFGDL